MGERVLQEFSERALAYLAHLAELRLSETSSTSVVLNYLPAIIMLTVTASGIFLWILARRFALRNAVRFLSFSYLGLVVVTLGWFQGCSNSGPSGLDGNQVVSYEPLPSKAIKQRLYLGGERQEIVLPEGNYAGAIVRGLEAPLGIVALVREIDDESNLNQFYCLLPPQAFPIEGSRFNVAPSESGATLKRDPSIGNA